MNTQRFLFLVIFAGISLLLTAPSSHANLADESDVQGPVGISTGAGAPEVQGSVAVATSGGVSVPNIRECLDIILAVPGCLNEIISSFRSLQPKLLGPRCCDAVLRLHGGCFPKLSAKLNTKFPFTLIKNFCAARAGSAPAPPCKDISATNSTT